MTSAFVLSGGGNVGAVHVGMLLALEEAGVRPDLVVGTSVGAVNGAWLASGLPSSELAKVWESLRRSDVFPFNPFVGLAGFAGRANHVVSQHRLRRLLERHVTIERLEDAPIPLGVVATDVLTGGATLLKSGPAVDAVLASAAIPAIFAPVKLGGRWLMDGGVIDNAPISHAVSLGADRIWVLAAGYSCALDRPPQSALGMGLHAATLSIHARLALDVERYAATHDLRVIPPLCPLSVAPTDFSQSRRLIERAQRHTRAWLDAGVAKHPTSASDAAANLAIHTH